MSYKQFNPEGSRGKTHLIGGQEVSKSDVRIEVLGDIDELNCQLGVVGGFNEVQKQLFLLSSYLANPEGKLNKDFFQTQINRMETECSEIWDKLPKLTNFVLPGGSSRGSLLHLSRAMCRRAERHLAALVTSRVVDELTLLYVNRLSDWLFVNARLINFQDKYQEEIIDIRSYET